MGQVSFNEDIDKLRTDLLSAKDNLWKFAHSGVLDLKRQKKVFEDCFDKLVAQLDRLKEIAGEPDVVLAEEIKSLWLQRDALETKNIVMTKKVDEVEKRLANQEIQHKKECGKLLKKIGDIADEKSKVEKRLDDIVKKSDFGTLVNSFSPTQR